MKIRTLFQYLLGRRSAIVEVATNPHSLRVGFLLCLSAGLAREYHSKYLLRQPWYLLLPAAVSVAISAVVFLMFYLSSSVRARRLLTGMGPAYLSFLGLFWMTAPLAWLYGIPYERLLNEFNAAQARVLTVELVSTWRVLLVARAVAVITGRSFFSAFVKIAVPAFAVGYVG